MKFRIWNSSLIVASILLIEFPAFSQDELAKLIGIQKSLRVQIEINEKRILALQAVASPPSRVTQPSPAQGSATPGAVKQKTTSDGFLYRGASPGSGWSRSVVAGTPIEVIERNWAEHTYKVKIGNDTGYMLGINLAQTDELNALKSSEESTESSGDSSGYQPSVSSGGPVHVREYRRKDGTVVRAHTRRR